VSGNLPAFPLPHGTQAFPGITIRDYFAAAALSGELASQSEQGGWINSNDCIRCVAEKCYRIADAMLKAREIESFDE